MQQKRIAVLAFVLFVLFLAAMDSASAMNIGWVSGGSGAIYYGP